MKRPSAFVPISDPAVLAVPVRDNGEPLVDVRGLPGVQWLDGYAEDPPVACLVRQGVAERLVCAAALLPPGLQLGLAEGLRPLVAQAGLLTRVAAEVQAQQPHLSAEQALAQARLYVAPLEMGPPHACGAAVDVTLLRAHGDAVDMGSALNEASERSHTAHSGIAPAARRHRRLLAKVMREAGFVNYPAEWWHWSWGDRYWAHALGRPCALYGVAEHSATAAAQLQAWRDSAASQRR